MSSSDGDPGRYTAIDAKNPPTPYGYQQTTRGLQMETANARRRFTLCTCVDSRSSREGSEPTAVGILFKAKPGGVVLTELNDDTTPASRQHIVQDFLGEEMQIERAWRRVLPLLLHHGPESGRPWTRERHYRACNQFCGCCASHVREDGPHCKACYDGWVLTTVSKTICYSTQSCGQRYRLCQCGSCMQLWFAYGWRCPNEAFQ